MTLKQIFKVILNRIYLIVGIPFVSVVAAIVIVYNFIQPTYTAATTVYVLNRQEDRSLNYSDLNASLALIDDYRELALSTTVLGTVAKEFGYGSKGELRGDYDITISSVNNTRIIRIAVAGPNKDIVADVANAIGREFTVFIIEIMDVANVNVVDTATPPAIPSGPKKMQTIALAGIAGMIVSIAITLLIEALNTTIRTPEDAEKVLGLPVLAKIPKMEEI